MKSIIRNQYRRRRTGTAAFTLVELLAGITIIAILAATVAVVSAGVRKKAEQVQCGENLKSLHMALSSYLIDHKHWPQNPPIEDEEQYWKNWALLLEDYDLVDKVWMCPTHKRATKDEFLRYSSYHPIAFDRKSIMTPHRWSNMPWVLEIGDNHGNGPLMIMADGSIQTSVSVDKPFTTVPSR